MSKWQLVKEKDDKFFGHVIYGYKTTEKRSDFDKIEVIISNENANGIIGFVDLYHSSGINLTVKLQEFGFVFYGFGNNRCVSYKLKSIGNLTRVLESINEIEKIDVELIIDLHTKVGLPIPESIIIKKINGSIKNGAYQEAITYALDAQKKGYYEPIWQCVTKLEKIIRKNGDLNNLTLDDVFRLYQDFSLDNPRYKDAMDRATHILMNQETDSEEKKQKLLESKFMFALESQNQLLIDQYFNKLCGYEGLLVKRKNIKRDGDTLIALAKKIKTLTSEVNQLKKECSQLKSVAAEKRRDSNNTRLFTATKGNSKELEIDNIENTTKNKSQPNC